MSALGCFEYLTVVHFYTIRYFDQLCELDDVTCFCFTWKVKYSFSFLTYCTSRSKQMLEFTLRVRALCCAITKPNGKTKATKTITGWKVHIWCYTYHAKEENVTRYIVSHTCNGFLFSFLLWVLWQLREVLMVLFYKYQKVQRKIWYFWTILRDI